MTKKTNEKPRLIEDLAKIPRYPPFARGLPAVDTDQLMATQDSLIKRIRLSVGCVPEHFDKYYLTIIENYANYVHLLPASEAHHHQLAGGLFRHGLEVAWEGCKLYKGRIMTGRMVADERKVLEPRWQMAVFILAICHDLGKPAFDLEVTDQAGERVWDPHSNTLGSWLQKNKIDYYYIHWCDQRTHRTHEYFSSSLLHLIVSPQTMQYLSSGSRLITRSIHESLSGTKDVSEDVRVISAMVSEADSISVSYDLRKNHITVGGSSTGVPVAKHLIDAMRRLVRRREWKVNRPGSRIWADKDNVFIVWHAATDEMKALLKKDDLPGIPYDPNTLADILIDRDIIIPYVDVNGTKQRYWKISPALNQQGTKVTLNAVKLRSFDIISDDPLPAFADIIITDPINRSDEPVYQGHESETEETQPVTTLVRAVNADDLLANTKKQHNKTGIKEAPAPQTEAKAEQQEKTESLKPPEILNKANNKTPGKPTNESINKNAIDQYEEWDVLTQLLTQAQKKVDFERYFKFNDKQFFIVYPKGLQDLTLPPKEYIKKFESRRWLCTHIETPLKMTMSISVGADIFNAIVFNENVSRYIAQYIGVEIDTITTENVKDKELKLTDDSSNEIKNEKPIEKTKKKAEKINKEIIDTPSTESVSDEKDANGDNKDDLYIKFIAWLRENSKEQDVLITGEGIWFEYTCTLRRFCKQTGTSMYIANAMLAIPGRMEDKTHAQDDNLDTLLVFT